ncbi:uncharacterized protein LOC119732240 isoform X1 [Patiria miniata]|uniref:SAM domain-containing protein n=2 Tax=Patiria miniata TaxID=46514 RepID=A0A914ACP0_PATMI|nr:uncharacterized protein LOC119723066 isoform X1 [Patiria miniata]XP_038061607.1 uncharacterized protein LOC119732240 isoform X1 [Patiria miniata]
MTAFDAKPPSMANQVQETEQEPKGAVNHSPPTTPAEVKIKTEIMEVAATDEACDLAKVSGDKDHVERSGFASDKEDMDEEDEEDFLNHEYSNGLDEERFSPMSGNIDFGMMSGDLLRSEDYQPFRDVEGNQVLEVDCGSNRALLYVNKLCQGSKGQSILFENRWHTPNEFQFISGRETAKDWKRSIRHRGKSLKILMSRGLLQARTRPSDKRNASNGCLASLNNSATEKKRKLGQESEPSQLNQIINHLHQTNGSHLLGARDGSRKRSMASEYRNGKRSRSTSPTEGDIYDEQQRCIFQAANSPEPQNIENARKSLNLSTNSPDSPLSSTSGQSSPVSFVLGDPQSLTNYDKQDVLMAHKSRKQNSPQHFEMHGAGDKEREISRSPHIVLVSSSNSAAFQKGQASLRPRFHSHQPGTRINGNALITGPQQPLTGQGEGSRRTQSLLTPTAKTPSVKMIELTRPDAVPKTPAFPDNRNNSAHNSTHSADGVSPSARTPNNDAVFLPSDMSLWTVDDVAQFIQSLKGCEEYVQVFRDQAIDGEILPVLTEDHLLQNMGLKLGPALKIRLRVARRLGFTLDGQYCQLKPPYEEPPTH